MKKIILILITIFWVFNINAQKIVTIATSNTSNLELTDNIYVSINDYITFSNHYSFNDLETTITSLIYINYHSIDLQTIKIIYSDESNDVITINKLINTKVFYLNRIQRNNIKDKMIKRIKCSNRMFKHFSIDIDNNKAIELNQLANQIFKY